MFVWFGCLLTERRDGMTRYGRLAQSRSTCTPGAIGHGCADVVSVKRTSRVLTGRQSLAARGRLNGHHKSGACGSPLHALAIATRDKTSVQSHVAHPSTPRATSQRAAAKASMTVYLGAQNARLAVRG